MFSAISSTCIRLTHQQNLTGKYIKYIILVLEGCMKNLARRVKEHHGLHAGLRFVSQGIVSERLTWQIPHSHLDNLILSK